MNEYWCIPPKENAEFVACMDDVLHVYSMPYNPDVPVICMDEKPYQLAGKCASRWRQGRATLESQMPNMNAAGHAAYLYLQKPLQDGAMPVCVNAGQNWTEQRKSDAC